MDGFETYHVMNPYDDGIGLDEYVDWLIDAGYPIAADRRLRRRGCSGSRPRCVPCQNKRRQASLAAAVAQLPATRKTDPRIHRADRAVPFRGAGRENRPRQRHSARHGADHRQIHHQPATARIDMKPTRSPATKAIDDLVNEPTVTNISNGHEPTRHQTPTTVS